MKSNFTRYFLFLLTIGFFYHPCQGQQQIMFTQYMFNGLALNPAYAGSDETLNLTILAREQWLGFEGGPSNQVFSGHMPVGQQKKVGIGLLAEREKSCRH